MNKKVLIAIIFIIIIGVGGWLFWNNRNKGAEVISEINPEEEISDQQLRQTIVSLYFQNKDTNVLAPEGRLIDVKLLLNDPYNTILQLLIEGPKNEQLEGVIPEGTRINNIELKKDILYIDLSKEFIDFLVVPL